jgi:hypothetical protein
VTVAALAAALVVLTTLVLIAVRTTVLERTPALVRVRPSASGSRQTGR